MDWFRVYHGMPTDPKWILVARLAGLGVTPGHVVAVWSVLLDHASLAKPRGSVASADLEAIAASLGWDDALIGAIYDALVIRRHIVDGCLRTWRERNPVKFDATNVERQARHREKAKNKKNAGAAAPESAAENNESNARYGVTGNASRDVTPTEEKEQSNCDFSEASADSNNPSLKQTTTRTVRERTGALIDAGGFWEWIAGQGIPAHIGIRTMNRGRLVDWLERGLTDADLDEAMSRARQKRSQQGSAAPVNIGFLACFVEDVLTGTDAQTTTGGGYERGDQLSREFANVG